MCTLNILTFPQHRWKGGRRKRGLIFCSSLRLLFFFLHHFLFLTLQQNITYTTILFRWCKSLFLKKHREKKQLGIFIGECCWASNPASFLLREHTHTPCRPRQHNDPNPAGGLQGLKYVLNPQLQVFGARTHPPTHTHTHTHTQTHKHFLCFMNSLKNLF